MADAYNTSTALSDLARTQIYNSLISSAANKTNNAFMQNSIDLSPLFGPQDTTLKFPVLAAQTLQAVTEGTAIERKQYSSTSRSLSLSSKYADLVPIVDFVRMASRQGTWDELGTQLGILGNKTIDAALGGLYTSSPNDVTNATTTCIDETDILLAKTYLDDANAPGEGRVLLVNSDQYNKLLTNANFVSNALRGTGNALVTGVIGSIHGFEIHLDQNVVETAGLARNMAFVRGTTPQNSSLGYAIGTLSPMMSGTPYVGDKMRLSWSRNATMLSDEMTFEVMFGVIALRPEWIVEVQSRD